MRIRAAFPLALVVIALLAGPAAADWIVNVESFTPHGIVASPERIMVFADENAIELGSDGTERSEVSYTAKSGRLQIERVFQARDGFIACGVHFPEESEEHVSRPMVMRLNANGDVQWARSIEANSVNMTVAAETTSGDIIVATRTLNAMLLLKFSGLGEMKWSRILDRTDIEGIKNMVATRDGGVLLIGTALTQFAALTRIDADGKVVWDRVLGSSEAAYGYYGAVQLPDGGFVAAGRMRTLSTSNRDGWLTRVSARGEVVWDKAIGGDAEDGLYAITQTGENEFAALGGTKSAGKGDVDNWIVAFDADGTIAREFAVGDTDDNGPQDPNYGVVASADGDVVFASPGILDNIVIGRIRSASAECKWTRAIRTAEHRSGSTSIEAALIEQKFAAVIHPVDVMTRKLKRSARSICQWTGGSAPEVTQQIAVEPPDEEALFADEVARLLIAREFQKLDAMAATNRNAHLTFDSGRSKLRAFYWALGRHSSLLALGAGHQRLLDDWSHETHSATSKIALAAKLSAAAERVRGAGFANSMLDAEAGQFDQLSEQAMKLLAEVEVAGSCDAPCYDLQIRTAKLGGWSEPLQKLIAQDPKYWEVFERAALYLGENWGGERGAIAQFVEESAAKTKESLGDALYALHYAKWIYGVIHVDGPAPKPPAWPRIRAGFIDLQRLYPKSRQHAHLFAAAAYRVARDRDTARTLFQSPLLSWSASADVWRDRLEYERAKVWALSEPVEPFASQLSGVARGSKAAALPRLVASARFTFPDGKTEQTNAFLVATPSGLIGMSVPRRTRIFTESGIAPPLERPVSGVLDGDTPLSGEALSIPHMMWATFTPPVQIAKKLHALKPRVAPLAIGDRLFIVACATGTRSCTPRVVEVRLPGGGSGSFGVSLPGDADLVDRESLAGAPAFDDDGAVAGMVMPFVSGSQPEIVSVEVILGSIGKSK